jgi:hypothetical protein
VAQVRALNRLRLELAEFTPNPDCRPDLIREHLRSMVQALRSLEAISDDAWWQMLEDEGGAGAAWLHRFGPSEYARWSAQRRAA